MSTPLSLTIAAAAGVVTWSFGEYVLHRWAGHAGKGRHDFSREHLAHHSNPDYFAPTWKKLLIASITTAVMLPLASLLLGWSLGTAYTLGFIIFYGVYEVIHRRIHTHAPLGPYGRMVRRHHLAHHFSDARQNHGVTTRFWDRVFGTFLPVEQIKIPNKLVMPWLLDKATGDIRSVFQKDYRLSRKAKAL